MALLLTSTLMMKPELQSLLDKLNKSKFADLKGSRANLHLVRLARNFPLGSGTASQSFQR
jgi:hypothetical protein